MAVPTSLALTAHIERWPIAGAFTISRGAKTEAVVVVAELSDGVHTGRGECVPYPRYGETPDRTLTAVRSMREPLRRGMDRAALQTALSASAARNALDCAFFDLQAKQQGVRAWTLAGQPPPVPLTTAFTISLGTPEMMAQEAAKAAQRPLLKIKLGGEGDEHRIAAVRRAAPQSVLIVDANEAWSAANLERNLASCAAHGVTMVEQPLPAAEDAALSTLTRPVPVCADESVHDRASLAALRGKYDAVNIKLDKTGGLTEALAMRAQAKALGFGIMVGCMVATSLAMAPAFLVAQPGDIVDLDGPLLLARDRDHGLHYESSLLHPPDPALWG